MVAFSEVPATIPATVLRQHVYDTPHKTAVVLGLPQGGTSMLAAVVDALGVPMTAGKLFNFEAEDGRPHVGDTLQQWIGKVEAWNERADVWGFKDTIIWRFDAQAVQAVLRNPYYLVAVRDVAAITQRRAANHGVTDPRHLASIAVEVAEQSSALWRFLGDLQEGPLLIVSYERAIRDGESACRVVGRIANFLGLQPTNTQVLNAIGRISQTGGYLTKDGT